MRILTIMCTAITVVSGAQEPKAFGSRLRPAAGQWRNKQKTRNQARLLGNERVQALLDFLRQDKEADVKTTVTARTARLTVTRTMQRRHQTETKEVLTIHQRLQKLSELGPSARIIYIKEKCIQPAEEELQVDRHIRDEIAGIIRDTEIYARCSTTFKQRHLNEAQVTVDAWESELTFWRFMMTTEGQNWMQERDVRTFTKLFRPGSDESTDESTDEPAAPVPLPLCYKKTSKYTSYAYDVKPDNEITMEATVQVIPSGESRMFKIRKGLKAAGGNVFIDTDTYRIKDRTAVRKDGEPLIKFHNGGSGNPDYFMNVTDPAELPALMKFLKSIHFQTEEEYQANDDTQFYENVGVLKTTAAVSADGEVSVCL